MQLRCFHPDQKFMRVAIDMAVKNFRAANEHPIGAVLVHGEEIVAQSGNRCHMDQDPSAHAEIVVVRQSCAQLCTRRLDGCALYVTHEPCPMCVWAMVTARLGLLIWGTSREDARAFLRIPQEFRLQNEDIDSILAGARGDRGISYFPHRYPEICQHLLLLCSEQRPLDFGPLPFNDRAAVESRAWCRKNLKG